MVKKQYNKPLVTFFPLEVTTGLSTECLLQAQQSQFECPVMLPRLGETVVVEGACDMTVEEADDFICYHNPSVKNNVFGS